MANKYSATTEPGDTEKVKRAKRWYRAGLITRNEMEQQIERGGASSVHDTLRDGVRAAARRNERTADMTPTIKLSSAPDWRALTQEINAAQERLYYLEEAAEENELDSGEEDITANTCISLERVALRAARLAARDAVLAHRRGDSAEAARLYAEAYQQTKSVAR